MLTCFIFLGKKNCLLKKELRNLTKPSDIKIRAGEEKNKQIKKKN